ncbi:MAG TPA: Fe2+-dependent dioxygenase [Caulobacter sp.]|nr:Fe2+-dependent dioxygenase [Caulobacter sp.]
MMLQIPGVLTREEVGRLRALIDRAEWIDGNVTAGFQSALAKQNRQLAEGSPAAREAGATILAALERNPLFIAAALPARIYPPLFNRYGVGDGFGDHIDNSIRRNRLDGAQVRTDLSATLFLTEAEDYDGGELTVDDTYGVHQVKLAAGDLILYPASSLHRVEAITRGARVSSFFWIQSLVRDDARRALLFDMDMAIQRAGTTLGQGDPSIVSLTGAYHNLLRMWAEP